MKPQQQSVQVAVVIDRVAAPNAWEDWAFRLVEVLPDEGVFGAAPRCLHDDGKTSRWLYPGHRVQLFADECKGYFLNLTSGRPAWFVFWVQDVADPSALTLTGVSVSYIEADRRMTAEEVVENVPLDDELCEWLRLFTNAHFRPDTGRKVRAMSFLSPEEREKHAQADASNLSPDASYTAAVAPGVDAQVRNEALRKLFLSDPHFKQGDGLDVAVDEVVELAQSAKARQHKIQQARALGLLDDDLQDQQAPDGGSPPRA